MKPLLDRIKDLEAEVRAATSGSGSTTVIQSPGATGATGATGAQGPPGPAGSSTGGLGVLPGGYAQVIVDQTGIGSTLTPIAGAQITVDVAANRYVRLTGYSQLQQLTSAAFADFQIREVINPGITDELQAAGHTFSAANQVATAFATVVIQPTPGTHTYQLQASTTAGTLSAVTGSGQDPIWIMAEDIGPFLGVVVPPQQPTFTDAFTGTNGNAWASPWTTGTFTTGGHSGASTEDIQTNKGRMLLNGTTPGAGAAILDPAKGAVNISDQEIYLEFTTQGTLGSWFFDLLVRSDATAPTSSAQNAVGVRVDTAGTIQIASYVSGTLGTSAPKFVQANNPTAGNPVTPQTAVTVAYPGNNTAGNHGQCAIMWNDTTSTISSVVDTAGNTWTAASAVHRGTTHTIVIYYAENLIAGANSVTVTFSGSVAFPDVFVCEHSGLLTSSSLDKVAAAHGTSTAPDSGATATTSQASEMLFGAILTNNAVSAAGSGYVLRCTSAQHSPVINDASGDAIESQIVNATGAYHATATTGTSAEWAAAIATFKGATAASTPVTIASSKTYGLRLLVQGLTYSANCWDLSGSEPTGWMVQYTDLSGVTPTSGTVRLQLVPQGAGVSQRVDIDNFSRIDLTGVQTSLPDLTVLSLVASPATPNVGDEVSFTGVVSNVGAQVTPPGVKIDLGIFVDPPDISVNLVGDDPSEVCWNDNYAPAAGLAPGGTQSLTTNSGPTGKATWTATAGTHSVYAVVDTHDLITESSVTNVFLISLTVGDTTPTGCDVQPIGITMSPVNPVAGDVVTFGGVIKNAGDTKTPDATNIKAEWSIDGGSVLETENNYSPNPGLGPGLTHAVTANTGSWTAVVGSHTLTMALDSGNILSDTHRTDKSLTNNITVAPAPSGKYPLTAHSSGRYFVDQQANPIFIAADGGTAAQGAIGTVNLTDWTSFVTDRKAKGFNAISFDALATTYTGGRSDGRAFDGTHAPFTSGSGPSTYDISTPATAAGGYWVQFDAFVAAVQNAGVLAIIDPIETGGWLTTLQNAGTTKATNYGRFLGTRYKNVLWLHGNDAGQPGQYAATSDRALMRAVRDGIKATDPGSLHTVEWNQLYAGGGVYPFQTGSASRDEADWESSVDADGDYEYNRPFHQVLNSWARSPAKPCGIIESDYENSVFTYNGGAATLQSVRRPMWWGLTSGAKFHFYGRGVSLATGGYDTTGVTQLGYMVNLISGRAWYNLVPDGTINGTGATLITSGRGTYGGLSNNPNTTTWITAAITADKTLAIAYLPQGGSPTFNMAKFAGQTTVRWYDPTNGTFKAITGSPFANNGTRAFTSPGANSEGNLDWVLVFEASTAPTGNVSFGFSNGYPLAYSNTTAFNQELTNSKAAGAAYYRGDVLSVNGNGPADTIVPLVGAKGLKFCAVLGGSSKSLSPAICSQIVAKYGPSSAYYAAHGFGIDVVEILNEPNCGTGALSAAAYWAVASPCITAIRSADAAIPIWVGAICNGGSTTTLAYATALVAASGTFPAGCHLSYHDYGSYAGLIGPSGSPGTLRQLLDNNGMSDRLIHATEDGSYTGPGSGGQSQATQATFITNHITAWKAADRVGVWFCYQIHDVNSGDGVIFDNRGLYTTAYVAKSAVAAYTNGVTTP